MLGRGCEARSLVQLWWCIRVVHLAVAEPCVLAVFPLVRRVVGIVEDAN